MDLPKLLIISQPFNNDTGGGITLSNLFLGWDREKLAVICSGYLLENNIDTSYCSNYYQIGHKEEKWMFPFSLFKRKYHSGVVRFDHRKIQNLSFEKSKLRLKLISKYFTPLLNYTCLVHFCKRLHLSVEMINWIKEFDPDLFYIQAGGREKILFCNELNSYFKKPVVFHMMDDWPSILSELGIFGKYWEKKIDREFKVLLNNSSLLLSICEEMSLEYQARYNMTFIPFHNPVDVNIWKANQKGNYEINGSPTVLYAGRVGLGIDDSLQSIAKAIDKVNRESGSSIKFLLQVGNEPAWGKLYDCVVVKELVDYEELPKVFSNADILILPYDFSEKAFKFIRYSMPTKASEYMISGTPIIVFAPKDTAIVKYAERYNWAEVITENSYIKVAEVIRELINNKEKRVKIAKNAVAIAEGKHDARYIREEFRKLITSVTVVN